MYTYLSVFIRKFTFVYLNNKFLLTSNTISMKISTPVKRLCTAWTIFLSIAFSLSFAQTEISGKILDAGDGLPVEDAIISIPDTDVSAISSGEGIFTLSLEKDQEEITLRVFSELYETSVNNYNPNKEILISLNEKIDRGYDNIVGNKTVGDIEVINIGKEGTYPSFSVLDALKGIVPGLHISSFSGQPDELPGMTIRGLNTFIFNSEPLVIIDEIPGLRLEDIDVGDIESVTILKDAASTAMYGSAGSNGVMLIRTKRGIIGAKKININASYGIATGNHYSTVYDLMDGTRSYQYVNNLATSKGDDITPYLGNEFLSGELINQNNLQNTNWQEEVFRMAPAQTYNLSTRGGDESTLYYFSGSYAREDGIITGTDNERYAFRLNLDKKLNRAFDFTGDIGFSRNVQSLMPLGFAAIDEGIVQSALLYMPFLPAKDNDDIFYENPLNPEINGPLAIKSAYDLQTARNSFSARGKMKINITDKLKYIVGYGGNITLEKFDKYVSIEKTYMGRSLRGIGESSSYERTVSDINNSLTYATTFGNSDLSLLAGYYYHNNNYGINQGFGTNFSTDFNPLLSAAGNKSGYSNALEHTKNSFLAVVDYGLNDKYFFSVKVRGDASSRFDDELYTFPGVGFKWDVKNEGFLQENDLISKLNVNLSYGTTGNDGGYAIGTGYMINAIPLAAGTMNDTLPGIVPDEKLKVDSVMETGHIYNTSGLKMETMSELNAGFEIGLFNNNIFITADYFSRNIDNLILPVLLPGDFYFENFGSMKTSGVDVSFSSKNVSTGLLAWNTGIMLTILNNEVSETGDYNDDVFTGGMAGIVTGNPLYSYVDNAGELLGQTLPDMIYGIKNTFKLGPVGLNVLLQGTSGNSVLNVDKMLLEQGDAYVNQSNSLPSSTELSGYVEDASHLNIREVKLEYELPLALLETIKSKGGKVFISGQNLLTLSGYSGYHPETSVYGFRSANIGGYPLPKYIFAGVNIQF